MKYLFPIVLLALLFTTACKDDEAEPILSNAEINAQDRAIINDFISKNNINADTTDSGLYYIIETPGVGSNPNINSEVTVIYKGYFMNDAEEVFDQTEAGKDTKFVLGGVIPGWQEGLQLMKPGGKARFFIPSRLAYGRGGSRGGVVPSNTPIAFDVELLSFK